MRKARMRGRRGRKVDVSEAGPEGGEFWGGVRVPRECLGGVRVSREDQGRDL